MHLLSCVFFGLPKLVLSEEGLKEDESPVKAVPSHITLIETVLQSITVDIVEHSHRNGLPVNFYFCEQRLKPKNIEFKI